jgi:hypothetical protein
MKTAIITGLVAVIIVLILMNCRGVSSYDQPTFNQKLATFQATRTARDVMRRRTYDERQALLKYMRDNDIPLNMLPPHVVAAANVIPAPSKSKSPAPSPQM